MTNLVGRVAEEEHELVDPAGVLEGNAVVGELLKRVLAGVVAVAAGTDASDGQPRHTCGNDRLVCNGSPALRVAEDYMKYCQ